jgi:hypothetical protein
MQSYLEDVLDMAPSDTQFQNLKKRVKELEEKKKDQGTPQSQSPSWTQRNQLLTWLIGLAVSILAIILTVYAGVIPHIEKHVDDQVTIKVNDALKQPLGQMGTMSNDIAEIKGTLKAWGPLITPQFFKRAASLSDKQFKESLPQLKAVAQTAIQNRTAVPDEDVTTIGKRAITLASANSDSSAPAWDTLQTLLQYRSFLNSVQVPLGPQVPITGNAHSYYEISHENTMEPPILKTIGISDYANSAQLRNISAPDLNKGAPTGPSLLVFQTPTLILDNLYAKNVVFENTHIIYRGGPLTLEGVYFLNCTFEIQRQTKSENFAEAILSGKVTDFQST